MAEVSVVKILIVIYRVSEKLSNVEQICRSEYIEQNLKIMIQQLRK